jgi:hypothetical protein
MPRQIMRFARLSAALLTACLLSTPTFAVVISSATDIANVKAPANDPGWLNVGEVGGGSAVYLGRGWVITAEHVEGNVFTLSDGRPPITTIASRTRAGLLHPTCECFA